MKTLYQAGNALEAHMLADLLKQEGLQAQVLGEHLQGAVGELPAAGLVRLVVEDEQYDAAREVIQRWERAMPSEPGTPLAPPQRLVRGGGVWPFVAGVLVGLAAMYAFNHAPATQDGVDHNRDGQLDETWTYSLRGTLQRVEIDRNLDQKVDHIAVYDERGVIKSAESDDDFDGRFETSVRYLNGNPLISHSDTDGDGRIDLVVHFVNGVMQQAEFRRPDTGRPARVEHYKLGKITHADLDTDGDGRLDTRISYSPLGEPGARTALP